MARLVLCDLCHEHEAAFSYTVFADGSVVMGCEKCAAQFALALAASLGALDDPLMLGTGEPEPGNGLPLPQEVLDEIEAAESLNTQPDPVTDEPTDEPYAQGPNDPPKRRRKTAA